MNTNIQAPPGDPVETTDFRTFHMNIIWLIIKTAISQLSSHNTDLTSTDCRQCLAEDWTDILRLRKIYILFEIFFVVQSFTAAKG